MPYTINRTINNFDFDQVDKRTRHALTDLGLGVLTEIGKADKNSGAESRVVQPNWKHFFYPLWLRPAGLEFVPVSET